MEKSREFTEQEVRNCINQLRQPKFLVLVAFHITAQALFRLVSRQHTEHVTLIDGLPFLKPEIVQYVHKSLELDFDDRSLYWHEIAQEVLSEVGLDGLSDENKASALTIWVTNRLLLDANIDSLPNYALVQLLGLRHQEETEALSKLSKAQKFILTAIFQKSTSPSGHLSEAEPVRWKPDELFPSLTKAERVTVSKSLQRLSERNLIQRLDIQQEVIPVEKEQPFRRTAFVRLTELGDLVSSRLLTLHP